MLMKRWYLCKGAKLGLQSAKRDRLLGRVMLKRCWELGLMIRIILACVTGSARGHALEPRTLLVYFFPRPRSSWSRPSGIVGLKASNPRSSFPDWLFAAWASWEYKGATASGVVFGLLVALWRGGGPWLEPPLHLVCGGARRLFSHLGRMLGAWLVFVFANFYLFAARG